MKQFSYEVTPILYIDYRFRIFTAAIFCFLFLSAFDDSLFANLFVFWIRSHILVPVTSLSF